MSQMPDSVFLHKDEKYNTCGVYGAYDDNYILAENEYDESSLDSYVEYTPIYRLEEAVRRTEKDLALTWEDIAKIITIYEEGIDNGDYRRYNEAEWIKEYSQDILRKFNEMKRE